MTLRERMKVLMGGTDAAAPSPERLERFEERFERLEQRLKHLEALVEGLQDAVHRDTIRHEERMTQLEQKTEPEAMARALSEDARRRGL